MTGVQTCALPIYRIPAPSEGEFDVRAADLLADVKLYDIMLTFQYLLRNYEAPPSHDIALEEVSTTEQATFLRFQLEQNQKILFSEVMAQLGSRLVIIVTFLAILDMIRTSEIVIEQQTLFSDLIIHRGARFGKI